MKIVSKTAQHNIFKFPITQDNQLTVSSNFDSGNLQSIQFHQPNTLIMTPANDCAGTQYQSLSRSWFYFSISKLPIHFQIKFIIKNLHMLNSVVKSSEHYKCVYRVKDQDWKRVENCIVITKDSAESTQLQFDFRCQKLGETFFAFTFPYSYQQCQKGLASLEKNYNSMKQLFYFNNQILINSPQNRSIHLLTISSHEAKQNIKQDKINQYLFNYSLNQRSNKFNTNKKIILITARVHPGQTPGSYAMNGIINFLFSKDARAMLLRKYFIFLLVPMLNPDGVYHGHYRMDIYNQNLNRFYLNPDPIKQPSIFAVKSLAQYLIKQDRLFFYMDLHAHAGKKGNFFYGNSIQNFNQQIQTQLFAKILSINCVNFQYDNCNFTKKHMNSKDRYQQMTKQGCGRVVLHKLSNIIYSYTLQCGYHFSSYLNQIPPAINSHRKYERHGFMYDEYDNIKSSVYMQGVPYFNPNIYENLGKSILISILDLFNKNPYSRIPNSNYGDIDNIRKEVINHLLKSNDKFKKQQMKLIYNKQKKSNQTGSLTILNQPQRQGFSETQTKSRLTNKVAQSIQQSKQRSKNIRIRQYTITKNPSKLII